MPLKPFDISKGPGGLAGAARKVLKAASGQCFVVVRKFFGTLKTIKKDKDKDKP